MRIIAGKFRSRLLVAPSNRKVRPTSDRLRETLFNVLAPRIEGAVFADLFAGTGAVGIEALSRGARHVYFAENSRAALVVLRRNLATIQLLSQSQVESAGTLPLLRRLASQRIQLDVVFLDPPYDNADAYSDCMQFLGSYSALAPDAIIVAEHSRRIPLPAVFGDLERYRLLEQGDAALSFFRAARNDTDAGCPPG